MGKGPLSGVKIIEMAGIGPGPRSNTCHFNDFNAA